MTATSLSDHCTTLHKGTLSTYKKSLRPATASPQQPHISGVPCIPGLITSSVILVLCITALKVIGHTTYTCTTEPEYI